MEWQINYLIAIEHFRDLTNHALDSFFLHATMFGELVIPILFICLVYWCINKKSGAYILFCYAFGFITTFAIKITACIYRPWLLSSEIHPLKQAMAFAGGYSFPSGHSTNATAIWGSTVVSFWKQPFVRVLLILIPLVMFSRNYVGVHTPQDVIVGFLVGSLGLFVMFKLLKWEEIKQNRDIIIAATFTLIFVLLLLYAIFKPYPMDYIDGQLLYNPLKNISYLIGRIGGFSGIIWGWVIEKRFINFEIKEEKSWKKLLRFLIGTAVLSLLYNNVFDLLHNFMDMKFALLIGYFVCGIFITAVYPYLCKVFKI